MSRVSINPYIQRLYGPIDPDAVLPVVGESGIHFMVGGFRPKVSSTRLRCFARDAWVRDGMLVVPCVQCNLFGTRFYVERHRTERPHLNLYAVNTQGIEILMTRDHVVPLAHGGPDVLENLVSMCLPCNERKADSVWINETTN